MLCFLSKYVFFDKLFTIYLQFFSNKFYCNTKKPLSLIISVRFSRETIFVCARAYKVIHCKILTHMIVEADRSQELQVSQQSGRPRGASGGAPVWV